LPYSIGKSSKFCHALFPITRRGTHPKLYKISRRQVRKSGTPVARIDWLIQIRSVSSPLAKEASCNDLAKEQRTMKTMRRWQLFGFAGFGLILTAMTGCQTNIAGMTLPSGHYMQHPPQYFAPSPAFPLQRELAAQEAQDAGPVGAGGAAPVAPGPVVPPPPPGAVGPPPR
jgi:hypothetical protein